MQPVAMSRLFSLRLLQMVVLALAIFAGCLGCAPDAPQSERATMSTTQAVSSIASEGEGAASGGGASESVSEKTPPEDVKAISQPVSFESDPAFDELKSEVESVLSDAVIDVGVVFVDLSDADRIAGFSVNGDTPLVAASMIKLAVATEFLDEVETGEIAMEEPYTVQAGDIVGGTGSVQSAGAGSTYTYGELARLMISESDNVGANVLIERMGMDAVNAQMEELGLANTHLVRKMMDESAMAERKENLMSAQDAAVLLALVYQGKLVSPTASAFMLEALEAQTDSVGLTQGLPEGVEFAHKTGTLAQVKNDGGIVEAEKPYVLVMFCSGADDATALELMGKVSKLVYERVE